MISLAVFQDRNSAKLLSGQLLSQVCDKMMSLGLVWVILSIGPASWVPWFLAAGALPHLFLAWRAGQWTAKLGALRTVVWTDISRGALFLLAGLFWAKLPHGLTLAALISLTLLANLASALFNPAILSLPVFLPNQELTPRLTAALQSCFSLANIAGPVAAAVLYPGLGLRGLLVLNGLSYFLAAYLEKTVRVTCPQKSVEKAEPDLPPQGTKGSWALLQEDSLIFFLLGAFFVMNISLTPLFAFLPLFAKFQFHGKIGVLAGMETAIGIGTVVGTMIPSVTRLPLKNGQIAIIGLLLSSLIYLSFPFSHQTYLTYAILGSLGLVLAVTNFSLLTVFQSRPKPDEVPIVMSLINLISVGAIPFSMALVGWLLDHMALDHLAVLFALIFVALTASTAFHRELRRV